MFWAFSVLVNFLPLVAEIGNPPQIIVIWHFTGSHVNWHEVPCRRLLFSFLLHLMSRGKNTVCRRDLSPLCSFIIIIMVAIIIIMMMIISSSIVFILTIINSWARERSQSAFCQRDPSLRSFFLDSKEGKFLRDLYQKEHSTRDPSQENYIE